MSEISMIEHKVMFKRLIDKCNDVYDKLRKLECTESVIYIWCGFRLALQMSNHKFTAEEYCKANSLIMNFYVDMISELLKQ